MFCFAFLKDNGNVQNKNKCTNLCDVKFLNIIDSISFFCTFLEDLIVTRFGWLYEKFCWKENKNLAACTHLNELTMYKIQSYNFV